MIWDKVAGVYDSFENLLNGKVYKELGNRIAEYIDENDVVLECACGTGAISEAIAKKCHKLVATDLSSKMMKRAEEKCRVYGNTVFRKANMCALNCRDKRFDKVVAGNVIHLLDDPAAAVWEMLRVCKSGGKVIIPTYINKSDKTSKLLVKACEAAGVQFKHEFTLESYKEFFISLGMYKAEFFVIEGRMPCAVAVIEADGRFDSKTKELLENPPYVDGVWDTDKLYEYLVYINTYGDNLAKRYFKNHLSDPKLAEVLLREFSLNDVMDGSDAQLGAAVVLRMMDRDALRANKELVLEAQKNEVYWKRPRPEDDDMSWL